MNQLFFYLFQVIAASGLLYGYYHFALRNKRFHRYNRFYLLMAIVISSFIPFLNIPVYFSQKETESSVMLQTLQVISSPSLSSESPIVSTAIHTESIAATWFTTANVIYLLYLFILSFFLIRVFISLGKIRFIIKKNPAEQIDRKRRTDISS
jgi:cytochrome c biogenesis factor